MSQNKITESEIEQFAIELLEHQGYQYIYAPDIAPDSDTLDLSEAKSEVVELRNILK